MTDGGAARASAARDVALSRRIFAGLGLILLAWNMDALLGHQRHHEWFSVLFAASATVVALTKPGRDERAPSALQALFPLYFIGPIAAGLIVLSHQWWSGESPKPLALASVATVAGALLMVPVLFATRAIERAARVATVTNGARAVFLLAVLLTAIAVPRRATLPSPDVLNDASPLLFTPSPNAWGEQHVFTLDDQRSIRWQWYSNGSNSERASVIAEQRNPPRTQRIFATSNAGDAGASVRYDPRIRCVHLTASSARDSFGAICFGRDGAAHVGTVLEDGQLVAPPFAWIGMGFAAMALSAWALKQCRGRSQTSTDAPFRSIDGSTDADEHAAQRAHHARINALWALPSAALMITPLVFALCARMLTG